MGLIVLPFLMFGVAAIVGLALFGLLLRILVRLLVLPLLLVKWIVMGIVLLVLAPVLAIVGALVFVSAGLVLFVPLLPVLAVGAILWFLLRATRRPALI